MNRVSHIQTTKHFAESGGWGVEESLSLSHARTHTERKSVASRSNLSLPNWCVQVLQNSDELFDREELSAAPDAGWPDCFNSGVFVYCPSLETYQRLINFAQTTGSFDGMP